MQLFCTLKCWSIKQPTLRKEKDKKYNFTPNYRFKHISSASIIGSL